MLQVSKLACIRGGRQLFSGLDFEVPAGGLLYLKGTNGAGKTSLLRILCGLSRAEAGEMRWNGAIVNSQNDIFRQELFYLGHQNAMQEALTVEENLHFYAALAGQAPDAQRTAAALGQLGVRACQGRLVRHLSQGQKRRVALSRLLLSPAKLWILDEPFVALDQDAIASLAGIVTAHLQAGGIAIMTSHQAVDMGAVQASTVELGV
jgi:heme exporter protein A